MNLNWLSVLIDKMTAAVTVDREDQVDRKDREARLPIRFLSWNVNWDGARQRGYTEAIVKHIIESKADIICLQEVPDGFEVEGYHTLFSVETHTGFVVMMSLEKYPVSFTEFTTGGIITVNNTSVAGCHLVPFSNNQPVREHQLTNVLVPKMRGNALIFGDFNWVGDVAIPPFVEIGDGSPTWDGAYFQDGDTRTATFDRVIVRGRLNATDYKVHAGVSLSDHFPITFTVMGL
jgi:endonuclease/exonuclease/phosphatase family metal-dependent hydrolase